MRWFVAAIFLVVVFGQTGPALAQECEGDPIEGFECVDPARSNLNTGAVFSASEGLAPRRLLREEEGAEAEVRTDDRRFGVFVNGSAAFRDIDQERELGSDSDVYGAVVGVDYTTDAFVAALSLDYFNENINFDENAGKNEVDEFGIQLLGIGYPIGNLYVMGATRVAYDNYDTERNIIGNLNQRTTAEGNPEGYKVSAVGGTGYDFNLPNGFGLGVAASLEYQRTHVDSYEEEGAEQVDDNALPPNLRFESDDRDTLTSALELNATKALSVPWGVLIPQAVFRYLHEFMDDPRTIEATVIALEDAPGFPPAESTVRFRTNKPDRDYFNLGAAVTSVFPQGWALFVDYHAVVGHSFREEHVVNFGVRTDFDVLRNLF